MFHILRLLNWILIFMCSVVLLGLTAWRIHYTKTLAMGDILTTRSHFFDPIIAELLATSILGFLFSLWFISAIMARVGRGPLGRYSSELASLFILFVMFLVGAAITTHKWSNLKFCRGSFKVCRMLETIKAFSHILWILSLLGMLYTFLNMRQRRHAVNGPVHGRDTYDNGTYPETRQTRTTTTTTTAYNNPNVTSTSAATTGHTTAAPVTGTTGTTGTTAVA
ncbi:hypothetical protein D9613_002330 [Agrocybe pediades]|uniref:MARVEL domain-containing protein n=1 Tax=Agrocybe pediades TaxID=84607 RepID=A0A8H4VV20_9AGAR|nr:hypothetical protein D9613_002330 [Agrocybe pediades]